MKTVNFKRKTLILQQLRVVGLEVCRVQCCQVIDVIRQVGNKTLEIEGLTVYLLGWLLSTRLNMTQTNDK